MQVLFAGACLRQYPNCHGSLENEQLITACSHISYCNPVLSLISRCSPRSFSLSSAQGLFCALRPRHLDLKYISPFPRRMPCGSSPHLDVLHMSSSKAQFKERFCLSLWNPLYRPLIPELQSTVLFRAHCQILAPNRPLASSRLA